MANRAINRAGRRRDALFSPSIQQSLRFLQHFLMSPQSVGSIAPSSPALVQALLGGIDWSGTHSIAELGGGTGAITRKIEQLRLPGSKFLCFEKNRRMHRELSEQFSDVILADDAFAIKQTLQAHQMAALDCVVCGLPLVNFPKEKRRELLLAVHEVLKPGGIFVAFQYTRRLRPTFVQTFDQMESRYVWNNLPPAYVYTCSKSQTAAGGKLPNSSIVQPANSGFL
jgi:phospholipid N-methyltransferase